MNLLQRDTDIIQNNFPCEKNDHNFHLDMELFSYLKICEDRYLYFDPCRKLTGSQLNFEIFCITNNIKV